MFYQITSLFRFFASQLGGAQEYLVKLENDNSSLRRSLADTAAAMQSYASNEHQVDR
jgi:hypothetical protein